MTMQLQERGGHRYGVMAHPVRATVDGALAAIQGLPDAAFDVLDNPFESKMVLRDKFNVPPMVSRLLGLMEGLADLASRHFGVPSLSIDEGRHYAGVFRYRPGDHLSAHVDAGIHPITKQRKHVTALLYLGHSEGGALELWGGDNCAAATYHTGTPILYEEIASIPPTHGQLVFFENNDYAWHAAGVNTGTTDRIVVTVSFLSDEVDAFQNKRERAFFIPRPGEIWTPEMYELRDRRSDAQRHAEVYRVRAMGGGA